MTRRRAVTLLAASLVAVLALLGSSPAGRTACAEDDPDLIAKIRAGFKKVDLESVTALVADVKTQSNDELLASRAELDRIRALVMTKWREYQRERWRFFSLQTPSVRAVRATLVLASLELERKERLERIEERLAKEYLDLYGESFYAKHPTHMGDWRATGAPERYTKEFERVGEWYSWAVKEEVKRIQSGRTAADEMLDGIAAECQKEIGALADARQKVQWEIWDRGLEPDAREADMPPLPGEVEEAHRDDLRLAPVRTEYEGKVGEPVEVFFQAWKGTKPYSWLVFGNTMESLSWMNTGTVAEPGTSSFLVTFTRPGTQRVRLRVADAKYEVKEVSYTVTVTGEALPTPKPPPKPDPKKPAGPGPGPAAGSTSEPAPPPVPISGTFPAVLFNGSFGLGRLDEQPKIAGSTAPPLTPVPLTVTIGGSGAITGKADYSLASTAMGKPSKEGAVKLFWKARFEISGQVDWTTGRTHIDVVNGHDEAGLEQDVAGYGHWRQWSKVDYTATLDGWSIPSPTASGWLRSTGAFAGAAGRELEGVGRPAVVPGSPPTFAAGGFFGDARGAAVPGGAPWKRTVTAYTLHTGYDGKSEDDEDQKKQAQMTVDLLSRMGVAGWYLRIGGPPVAESAPATTDPAAPASELWGFALWPEKGIAAAKGEVVRAQAMGVFAGDPFDAANLTGKATWTASPGLESLGDGSFRAAAPGTYTVTATFTGPSGPMSSTMTVVVK